MNVAQVDIALRADGAQYRVPAREGFLACVNVEEVRIVRGGGD